MTVQTTEQKSLPLVDRLRDLAEELHPTRPGTATVLWEIATDYHLEIERLRGVIKALQKAYSTGTVDDAAKAWAEAREAMTGK